MFSFFFIKIGKTKGDVCADLTFLFHTFAVLFQDRKFAKINMSMEYNGSE